MGVVFLGRDAAGRYVAIKLVHGALAGNPEFLARFRSEVVRARQVPSFCTAEVLDADLDHRPPYLVVEYVDGPSLAEVVENRGPLTSSNLHSVAVGVATALTGIHGAGVIHRDLKPENVLLAPGSPKVIDFGIARAFEATSKHTRTGQMVGTIAYMAPERFSNRLGMPLTPAADVFAWGCVVAYAGTGQTPFEGDSPEATAARILTQPPYLAGLAEPLRSLVELAVARDPADRPTARELLDMLVSAPAPAFARRAAGLRPEPVRTPAGRRSGLRPEVAAFLSPAEPGSAATETPVRLPTRQASRRQRPRASRGARFAEEINRWRDWLRARIRQARGTRWVAALSVLLVVAGIVAVIGAGGWLGRELFPGDDRTVGAPAPKSAAVSAPGALAKPLSVEPTTGEVIIEDKLNRPGQWPDTDLGRDNARCYTQGGVLRAERADRVEHGSYRCEGPVEQIDDDFDVTVTTALQSAGACAAIWFHWNPGEGGQVLRVCEDAMTVARDTPKSRDAYGTLQLARPITLKTPTRIHLVIRGEGADVWQNGRFAGSVPLPEDGPHGGQVLLGISVEGQDEPPPYEVTFANVLIRSL
jgi:hypothetical protein